MLNCSKSELKNEPDPKNAIIFLREVLQRNKEPKEKTCGDIERQEAHNEEAPILQIVRGVSPAARNFFLSSLRCKYILLVFCLSLHVSYHLANNVLEQTY